MQRRSFVIAAAAALTAGSPAARARTEEDVAWSDPARARTLPLRLRWPDGDGPCALVLHSHGLGGSRDGGDAWGRAWRDAGLAVIHLQHPGSDTPAVRGGIDALRRAASAEQLVARVLDVKFVIDEVTRRARADEPGFARVRLDAIGASGHSFGARTVQALAGERFGVAPALQAALAEPRLAAFVALSPSPGRATVDPATRFGAVTRPFLCVTGSLDGDPLGDERRGDHRRGVYDALPPGRRALLWLEGADHMTFGGNAERRLDARVGPLRRERAAAAQEAADHALVAAVTTAWWREHLLGGPRLEQVPALRPGDRWQRD